MLDKLASTGLKLAIYSVAIKSLSLVAQNNMANPDKETYKPRYNVSIIMPSYNEERFIEIAAMSVRNQSILQEYPESFEFILVDSGSRDRTVELASPYVDKVINAGRGKLTAIKAGTREAKGDIILRTDSDSFYPFYWANSILRPFNDLKYRAGYVVGVAGSTHDFSIPGIPQSVHDLAYYLDRAVIHPTQLPGRNAAYFKWAFYSTGEFNYDINQQNIWEMLDEEEVQLGRRLNKLGPVIFKANATCYHLGGQKIGCRMGLGNKQVCNSYKVGKDRF